MGSGRPDHRWRTTDQSEDASALSVDDTDVPSSIPNVSLLSFVLLTYAYSWSIWLIAAATGGHPIVVWLGAWGPSVAAITLVYRAEGRAGVRKQIARLAPNQTHGASLLAALSIPFAIVLTGLIVYAISIEEPLGVSSSLPLYLLPLHLVFGVLIGPLQEELGWRGLALPYLLATSSRVVASISVGVMWALWHLPLFLIENRLLPLGAFLLGVVASSFIYTEFFLRSGGSLALVVVLHAAFNTGVIGFLQGPADNGNPGPFVATSVVTVVAAAAVILLWTLRQRADDTTNGSANTRP